MGIYKNSHDGCVRIFRLGGGYDVCCVLGWGAAFFVLLEMHYLSRKWGYCFCKFSGILDTFSNAWCYGLIYSDGPWVDGFRVFVGLGSWC